LGELIVYPDAHPEVTSVDGWVREYAADGLTWAAIRGGTGYDAYDNLYYLAANIQADDNPNKWQQLMRAIMLFDTSNLPDDCNIDGATLKLYGQSGADNLGISPSLNIYSAAPASNVAVVTGDYDSLGTTPLATPAIAHTDWNQDGWNTFVLNAAGIATISKTGITKLGARLVCDATDSEPAWLAGQKQSSFNFYAAEPSAGACHPPELTIFFLSESESVDKTVIGNKVSLEAIRNLEIVYGGRDYVSKSGIWVHESRYHRNV